MPIYSFKIPRNRNFAEQERAHEGHLSKDKQKEMKIIEYLISMDT
jgi:hypothetical protein